MSNTLSAEQTQTIKTPDIYRAGSITDKVNRELLQQTSSIPNGVRYFKYENEIYVLKKSTLAHGALPRVASDKQPIVSVHIDIAKVNTGKLNDEDIVVPDMSDPHRYFEEESIFVLSLDQTNGEDAAVDSNGEFRRMNTTSDPFVPTVAYPSRLLEHWIPLEDVLNAALFNPINRPSEITAQTSLEA